MCVCVCVCVCDVILFFVEKCECKCKKVDKPEDQDLAGHAITKFHLTSSLIFLKTNIQEASPFPPIHAKSEFSPLTLLSFLLRKELESSLKFLLSNPWVHTLKERQDSILFLLHTLSKQLEHICSFNVIDIIL